MNKNIAYLLSALLAFPCNTVLAQSGAADSKFTCVIRNIELRANGTAVGKVYDARGQVAADTRVQFHSAAGVVEGRSDENGIVSVSGLKGGPCAINVGGNSYGCRFWAAGTAPPNSLTSFVVVHQSTPVVRGNLDSEGCYVPEGCDSPEGGGFLGVLTGASTSQLLGVGLFAGAIAAAVVAVSRNASD